LIHVENGEPAKWESPLIAMLRPSLPSSKNLSETVCSSELLWVSDHGDISRGAIHPGRSAAKISDAQNNIGALRLSARRNTIGLLPMSSQRLRTFPAGCINGEILGKAVKVDNGTTACDNGWLSCPSNGVTLLSHLDFSLENGAKVDLHDEYCSRKALLIEDPGTVPPPLSRWRHCL
jgi:hypothetical protein